MLPRSLCVRAAALVRTAAAQADLVVVNKVDLAAAMEVSVEELAADVHKLKPDLKVIPTSCKTGVGLDELTAALLAR